MRVALLCIAILGGIAQQAPAAIVLSLAPSTPGPIIIGNSFDVTLNVATDSGTISNLTGIGFELSTSTLGARFVSGTGVSPGTHEFLPPLPSQAFPARSVGYSFTTVAPATVNTTPVPFATFSLSTVGATTGNYSIIFDETFSLITITDLDFNEIPFIPPAAFDYTISPVPEPGSMLLTMGALAFGGRCWLKRRRS